ncbi:hypothetical protein SEVIR_7G327001v4 [Setaria viridis]
MHAAAPAQQLCQFRRRRRGLGADEPAGAVAARGGPPGGDGVERLPVPAEEEGVPAGVVDYLVRPAPPEALQQLPRLHHAAVAHPHPLHPGGLHPPPPLRQPLVPLLPLRPLPRHHAPDLLPQHQTLHPRPLRRVLPVVRRRRPLQAVEQRRVVVERLLEPLQERRSVVVRLRLRHHHNLRAQRPHRLQEPPQLRRPLLRRLHHRGLRRQRRDHGRCVRAQLQPCVQLPLQQLAEAARAGPRHDLDRGQAAAARDVPPARGVVGGQEPVQLRHHADGERLAGPDAEELPERVRVKIIEPRLHGAELERDVERLRLPGEHAGHVGEELLTVVHGRDAEVRRATAAAAESVEESDPLHGVGGRAGEVDDVHVLLPLHGLEDGVVGGQVRELHEREHVEQVAARRRDQVRLAGVGCGQQRAREARHEVEQLPRQRVGEHGGEALQRVGSVQGGQLRDLLQAVVGAVEGAGGHLGGALVQQANQPHALLVVAQLLHPRAVPVRRRRVQRRRRRRCRRRHRVLREYVHVQTSSFGGGYGQWIAALDVAVMKAIEDSIVGSCCVLGVATNVARLQGLEFIRS